MNILSECKVNSLFTLKNRIVMAPMTRASATSEFVPTEAMAEYYAKRADAGLIITEGTIISSDARGHNFVPGIFTDEQIAGWQTVTDRVHKNKGLIFCQIWHVGRASHPGFLSGKLPISASKTQMSGRISRSEGLHYGMSRAATLDEIEELVRSFEQAAKNAREAGFDGIEIHGANGYLIDQFLHHSTNLRQDAYGGSAENMARFALDIVHACGKVIGYERVGLRLSPGAYLNEIVGEPRDAAVFQYLLEKLRSVNLAYVHSGNYDHTQGFSELDNLTMTGFMRRYYDKMLITAGSYDLDSAESGIASNQFDLVALGRLFIANPDLISRVKNHQELAKYDASMLATLI